MGEQHEVVGTVASCELVEVLRYNESDPSSPVWPVHCVTADSGMENVLIFILH